MRFAPFLENARPFGSRNSFSCSCGSRVTATMRRLFIPICHFGSAVTLLIDMVNNRSPFRGHGRTLFRCAARFRTAHVLGTLVDYRGSWRTERDAAPGFGEPFAVLSRSVFVVHCP